jgi:fibronectin type 3 domain-containing protein
VSSRFAIASHAFGWLLLFCLVVTAVPAHAQSGPAGWWKFDEGTGTSTADSSGNGHTGTLVNSPTWVSGQNGPGALSFNGGTSEVTASGSGTLANLYSTGLTVSAWIKPTGSGGGSGGRIVDKDNNDSGWFFAMSGTTQVKFTSDQDTSGVTTRTSAASISLNTWQHVLVTWTGTAGGANVHIYINGVQADGASTDGTGPEFTDSATPLTIGNRSVDSARGFAGAIDEVRIYNRVLSTAEIQALADATAPSAPSGLTATAASGAQINLSWTASTDNIAVTGYRIERCQGSGCSNFAQVGTSTGTSYSDTGLSASTSYSYRVRAADAAANTSSYSGTASATTPSGSDTTVPTAPSGLTASAASSTQIGVSWTASTDNVGVTGYRLERCSGAGCSSFTQIATPTATSYTDTGLTAASSYTYRVRATDAAGNLSSYSSSASATTQSTSSGPVGWWKLDEGSGTSTADASGNGSTGTLVNSPTWSTGRIGSSALTFNGGTSEVTASGAGALANLYSSGLTVSVWINPTGSGGGGIGRIVDKDNNDSGWFLAMNGTSQVKFVSDQDTSGVTSRLSTASIVLNTWQHVLVTWSGAAGGANMHVYINGVQSDSTPTDGVGPEVADATTPLTIGNRKLDAARGFAGALDDVRIYSRVLSASEIQALAGSTPPSAPTSLAVAAFSSSQVNLSWTAATSAAGVTGYLIERCPGSACSAFTQIAATTTTAATYADASVSPSTSYSYRVRAKDANSNLSGYSNTISASTAVAVSYSCPSTGLPTVCYFYDEAGRLRVAQHDDGAQQAYILDAAGNRLASTGVPVSPLGKPVVTVTPRTATSMNISWTAASGGNGVFTYVLKRASTALSCTASPCIDTGLTANTQYTYTVTATDSDGNTVQSDPASATTYTVPVISSFSAATVSSTAVRLTWSASNANGPPGGLTYTVKRGSTTLACAASPCTDSGLSAGSSYTYTLTVADTAGDATTANTTGQAYSLPVIALTATPVTATSITLTWSATDTGGPGGLTYSIKRGTTVLSCTTSPCTDSGLSAGTSYTYSATATDSVGDVSLPSTATRATYTLPVITSFTATIASPTSITLTWSATDTGGPGGLTYSVKRGTTAISCTSSPCTDSGLTPNTSYTYTLTTTDSTGVDSTTATASATTNAPPGVPVWTYINECVRANGCIPENQNWNQWQDTWYQMCMGWSSTGTVTRYVLEIADNSQFVDQGGSPTTACYTVMPYHYASFRVKACNAAGCSDYAPEIDMQVDF